MAQEPSWQTAISSDTRLQGIQFSNKNVEISLIKIIILSLSEQ